MNGADVVMGYCPTLIHTLPVSWQALQVPLTPAWIMEPLGAGSKKALPGTERLATPGTKAAGVLPRWQFSQVLDVGRCEPAPKAVEGGITMILLMP